MKELKLENLTYKYGDFTAVEDVSFTLRQGEVVGFIGINGAGKSTTLKVLSGIQPDYEGDLTYDGVSLRQQPIEYKNAVGYLAENNPLYDSMYIREFLNFCAGLFDLTDKKVRIEEVINMVGLSDHANKKVSELSKGLKQRVGIAQALLHDPEILILDEPISGLDPNQIVQIRNLIRSLAENRIIIYSSHLLSEIEKNCDRAILIHDGKIMADKDKSSFVQSLGEEALLTVRFKHPVEANKLSSHLQLTATPNGKNQYVVRIKDSVDEVAESLFHFATKNNNPLLSLKESNPDFTDIFGLMTES